MPVRPQAERRVYIRKDVEIRRYGLTDGCPGCIAIATKSPPQPHNTACRTGIEGEMAKDPDFKQRLQEARKRRANTEPTAATAVADDPMGVAVVQALSVRHRQRRSSPALDSQRRTNKHPRRYQWKRLRLRAFPDPQSKRQKARRTEHMYIKD